MLPTAVLTLYPLVFTDPFYITVAINVGIALILSLSMNLIIGFSGQFSLAHSAFFGIGAYIPAILSRDIGLSPWLGLPAGVVAGVVVAAVIGIAFVRLQGYHFAVATLAFSFFVEILVRQSTDVTGGAYGIQGLAIPTLFSLPLTGATFYHVMLAAVIGTMALLDNLMRAPLGREIIAIRDHPAAAAATGINVDRVRLVAFMISAGLAALAGWVQAFYFRDLNPMMISPELAFIWLFMVFIGGLGHVRGIVAGTILLTLAPEFLGFATEQTILGIGVLMVLVALFAPLGLGGLLDGLADRLTRKFARGNRP